MSTISAVSSSPRSPLDATSTTTAPATAPVTGQQTLGINDFMNLLATQFEEQDPMQPMDDTAFIAQTAQFTSLQQTNTLVQQMTQLSAAQNVAAANSYLGRQVTVDTGNGVTAVGQVTAVDTSGSTPQIVINGNSYPTTNVLRVEPEPASSNTTTTPSPSTGGS
jgi:flagellar basal-body rod modification protein FlgD